MAIEVSSARRRAAAGAIVLVPAITASAVVTFRGVRRELAGRWV
jgi:hypothetical protein